MSTKTAQLARAHRELEKTMAQQEQGALHKAMARLRKSLGTETEEDLSKANSEVMPRVGGDQYPNDEGAAARIKAARVPKEGGKTPDSASSSDLYEDVPEAEDDTTDYETREKDILDGDTKKAKPVTRKSLANTDVYDQLAKSITAEQMKEVEASDILTGMTDTFAKSLAAVSRQAEAIGQRQDLLVSELQKSLAAIGQGLVAIGDAVAEMRKSEAPKNGDDADEEAEALEKCKAPKEMEKSEAADEGLDKSLAGLDEPMRKRVYTEGVLDRLIAMNAPSFLSKSMGSGDAKTGTKPSRDIDGPQGKALLIKSLQVAMQEGHIDLESGANAMGAVDFRTPRQVLESLPAAVRAKIDL